MNQRKGKLCFNSKIWFVQERGSLNWTEVVAWAGTGKHRTAPDEPNRGGGVNDKGSWKRISLSKRATPHHQGGKKEGRSDLEKGFGVGKKGPASFRWERNEESCGDGRMNGTWPCAAIKI